MFLVSGRVVLMIKNEKSPLKSRCKFGNESGRACKLVVGVFFKSCA